MSRTINLRGWLLLLLVLLLAAVLVLFACSSGGGGGAAASNNYIGTQSPGDVWTFSTTSTTFSAANETTGFTYSGTKSTLANGFLKLVVTASTEPGIPLDGTAVANAMEVPGTAMIVKPAGTDSKVIVMVAQGACPTAAASYNFVTIPRLNWDVLTDDAYGRADVTWSGATMTADVTNRKLDDSILTSGTSTATCSGGRLEFDNGDGTVTTVGFTPSGMFVGDNGVDRGGFVGVEAPATDITAAALITSGREFRGVLFKNDDALADDTQPVWVRTLVAGSSMQGGSYSDFENNVEDVAPNLVTLGGFSEVTPGLFGITLTPDSGSPSIFKLMVNQIDGKYVMFGISQNDDGLGGGYNVLLVEL